MRLTLQPFISVSLLLRTGGVGLPCKIKKNHTLEIVYLYMKGTISKDRFLD